MTIAIIDVGTNSTNLLVQDSNGVDVARVIATTRLGDTLQQLGTLSAEAIARTVDTIESHIAVAASHNATRIVITGTAACRRASNTQQFIDAVHARTALTVEVLSEKDEATFAFRGALTGLPEVLAPTVVIDIGGGSTEYTVGVLDAEMSASIPFGSVTGTASHITTDRPRPEDLTNLIGAVSDELEEIQRFPFSHLPRVPLALPAPLSRLPQSKLALRHLMTTHSTDSSSPVMPPKMSFAHWPPRHWRNGC